MDSNNHVSVQGSATFVNHQAILILSPKLSPAAFSPDGLIEAVEMPGKRFFMAVQWHPEYLFNKDGDSFLLFESFIEACIKE